MEWIGPVPAPPQPPDPTTGDCGPVFANPVRSFNGLPSIPPVDTKSVIANPSGNFNGPAGLQDCQCAAGQLGSSSPQWSMVLKVAYVTNLARQVDSNFNINTWIQDRERPSRAVHVRILPNVANATGGDTSHANYRAQVTVERRFAKGLAWLGSYTYCTQSTMPRSKAVDRVRCRRISDRFLDRGAAVLISGTAPPRAHLRSALRKRPALPSRTRWQMWFSRLQVNGLTVQGGLP